MNEGKPIQPNTRVWRVLALLWMAVILTLSSSLFAPTMSFDSTLDLFGAINYVVRKCAHAGEFGILMWLCFRSLYPSPYRIDKARAYGVAFSVLYAASDEYHQSFSPYRSGKASDVLFDAAGILIVAYVIGCLSQSSTVWRERIIGSCSEPD